MKDRRKENSVTGNQEQQRTGLGVTNPLGQAVRQSGKESRGEAGGSWDGVW